MGLLASNMISKEYGSNHHHCQNTEKKKKYWTKWKPTAPLNPSDN